MLWIAIFKYHVNSGFMKGHAMIENLSGTHEIVNYRPNYKMRLYTNDEMENYPPHWHAPYELIMPTAGPYRALCGDQEFMLKEGDVLIICPGTLHELFALSAGERIIFQPSLSCITLRELDVITSLLAPAVCITPERYPQIHARIRREVLDIQSAYNEGLPYAETLIYARFLDILCVVAQVISDDLSRSFDTEVLRQREYSDKFRSICAYINEHFAEELSLEQMADLAGFSKYHFSRLFKQYTNTTFYRYLNEKRINHAKSLLIDPDISVLDAAIQSGFSSHTAFLRMFRNLTGCTPTRFRQMYE